MILQLTNSEFQKVRFFIGKLNHAPTTKEFNEIFTKAGQGGNSKGVTGFVNPNNNDIIITIPERNSEKFLSVMGQYAPELGRIMSTPTIGFMEAPRLMSLGQAFLTDLIKAFT